MLFIELQRLLQISWIEKFSCVGKGFILLHIMCCFPPGTLLFVGVFGGCPRDWDVPWALWISISMLSSNMSAPAPALLVQLAWSFGQLLICTAKFQASFKCCLGTLTELQESCWHPGLRRSWFHQACWAPGLAQPCPGCSGSQTKQDRENLSMWSSLDVAKTTPSSVRMRVLEMLFSSQGKERAASWENGHPEICLASFYKEKPCKTINANVYFLIPACCGCRRWLGLLPGTWGKLPRSPKGWRFALVLGRDLERPHLETESPQAFAGAQIQEKGATNRQMPWNARRWFVGLRASGADNSHLSWSCWLNWREARLFLIWLLLKMRDWHENFTVRTFPAKSLSIRLCWNRSTENNHD